MTPRARLFLRLLPVWGVTLLLELALWWFFVRSSYYRDFFLPIAAAVAIAAVAVSVRAVRGSEGERRGRDRRSWRDRRDD